MTCDISLVDWLDAGLTIFVDTSIIPLQKLIRNSVRSFYGNNKVRYGIILKESHDS